MSFCSDWCVIPCLITAWSAREDTLDHLCWSSPPWSLSGCHGCMSPGRMWSLLLLLKCCFTFTETVGLLGTGAQDGHLDFHTAPELRQVELVSFLLISPADPLPAVLCLFATVLLLNRFGVTFPGFGQAVHARSSRQCCEMRSFFCFVLFFYLKLGCDSLKRYL